MSSTEDAAEGTRLAATLAGGGHRHRRDLILKRVRKVTIGDAMLGMLLNEGTMLDRSIERIRHGNDAKLIVGELVVSDELKSDPQLIILLNDAHRARILAMAEPNFALDRLPLRWTEEDALLVR